MALMRSQLDRMGATPYERFCTYLTAYSESDYYNDRKQKMQDGIHYTSGMFQQSDRWWPNPTDIPTATESFLNDFRKKAALHGDNTVASIWLTQMWNAPNPNLDLYGFMVAPETQNYLSRITKVAPIMADPLYFTHQNA